MSKKSTTTINRHTRTCTHTCTHTLTINKAREVTAIAVDKAVNVLKALHTALGQVLQHHLAQLKQFAHLVGLGVQEHIPTCERYIMFTMPSELQRTHQGQTLLHYKINHSDSLFLTDLIKFSKEGGLVAWPEKTNKSLLDISPSPHKVQEREPFSKSHSPTMNYLHLCHWHPAHRGQPHKHAAQTKQVRPSHQFTVTLLAHNSTGFQRGRGPPTAHDSHQTNLSHSPQLLSGEIFFTAQDSPSICLPWEGVRWGVVVVVVWGVNWFMGLRR